MNELFGLRGRLTLALLAVSALTLVITSLLLLFPLDRKLRQDVRSSVVETARTARPGLARLPAAGLRAGSPRLRRTADRLRRRTGLDIAFFDGRARLLVATDAEPGDRFPEIARALAERRLVSRFGRGDGHAQAQVAVPVEAHGRRFGVSFRRSLEDLNGAQDVVRRSLLAAAVVALGVALVIGIVVATRLARRLTALRDVALAVADQGPGTPVLADGSRDEIGDLARAFATMQRRLDAQEQARRAFVSTASHELRTPLASLRLMLHSAREELAEPHPDLEDTGEQIGRALEQTIRLGRLSDELLDLSRLDARVGLRSEPVDVVEVTRSVVSEFAVGSGQRRSRIELSAGGATWATGDPGGVARILRILIDNAVRHAPDDRAVRVRVERAGETARVSVADEGPGVPAADAERIFRRFERGAATDEDGGFGLGLAIGSELAQRMGGELRLEGQPPGATFALMLPAHAGPG